jgi:hypothetical protein
MVAVIASLAVLFYVFIYPAFVQPHLGRHEFCQKWKTNLKDISNPDAIPSSWSNVVAIRRFSDGWLLAAIHHGSCCSSGRGQFNAMVLRDSNGEELTLENWSPCAGTIAGIVSEWERCTPAQTLEECKRLHAQLVFRNQ